MSDLEADEADGGHDHIGWARAVLTAAVVVVIGFAAAVLGTNAILTQLTGVGRDARQYLASSVFLVVVIALAIVLRRLQARRLI